MKTRKQLQNIHAKKRAAQRYGLELKKFDIKALVTQIQNGKAVFLERQSLRITKWLVDVSGEKIPVVYDRKRKTIVTFLPPESHEVARSQQ